MKYGTYTCGLASGDVEFGFTFGEAANEEDDNTTEPCEIGITEFDVVLGVVDERNFGEIEPKWEKYRWVAEAIIAASKTRDNVEIPEELR